MCIRCGGWEDGGRVDVAAGGRHLQLRMYLRRAVAEGAWNWHRREEIKMGDAGRGGKRGRERGREKEGRKRGREEEEERARTRNEKRELKFTKSGNNPKSGFRRSADGMSGYENTRCTPGQG